MAQQSKLSKIDFMKKFSTHEACETHLFNMKWPEGYICEKCGCKHSYVVSSRALKLYQCKSCKYQATVIVNTVLEKTRTSLEKWFLAIFCIANDKRGISATQLMSEIGVAYQTAWTMLHKIRTAMAERDSNYQLCGIVDLDDAYIGTPTIGGKRGRGTDKTQLIIGVSLNELGSPEYAKISVIDNIKGNTILEFADNNIVPGSTINSDAYLSYKSLAEIYNHNPQNFSTTDDKDNLKWLHVVISNFKAFVHGTFHGLDKKHLQRYCDEFCYRFNRRKFKGQGFNRLLSCCANGNKITYSELVG